MVRGNLSINVSHLKARVDSTAGLIDELLGRHGPELDRDMASFIRCYLDSLKLDFELAMTRGELQQLELIVEDVQELLYSTKRKMPRLN